MFVKKGPDNIDSQTEPLIFALAMENRERGFNLFRRCFTSWNISIRAAIWWWANQDCVLDWEKSTDCHMHLPIQHSSIHDWSLNDKHLHQHQNAYNVWDMISRMVLSWCDIIQLCLLTSIVHENAHAQWLYQPKLWSTSLCRLPISAW